MSQGQDGSSSSAYLPTSLDFINLPNPIEPAAASQKHPLNGTPPLGKARIEATSNQELFKYLHESSNDRSTLRQKQGDVTSLDLPRLPPRSAIKRPRLPPTFPGLHQPPPDAGLLPSISTHQPDAAAPRPPVYPWPAASDTVLRHSTSTQQLGASSTWTSTHGGAEGSSIHQSPDHGIREASDEHEESSLVSSPRLQKGARPPEKRLKRNKWTDQETDDLLKGVARYGIGNWTKILQCGDFHFINRTALDLKDRFRVCCPDEYKKKSSNTGETKSTDAVTPRATAPKGPPPERVSSSKLSELGIHRPFVKNGRRRRHGYTPEEDEALLKGFKKYKNSWSTIRHDVELGLSHRKATDLRDRFRTRYPQEYADAGLSLRHDKASVSTDRNVNENPEQSPAHEEETEMAPMGTAASESMPNATSFTTSEPINTVDTSSSRTKRQPHAAQFRLDDVFLGMPFDDNDADNEPIVLDRGILDWAANDTAKEALPESHKLHGIDPQMTLKLPKPAPSVVPCQQLDVPAHAPSATNITSLPSLTAMLQENGANDQLELPSFSSFNQLFEPMDGMDGLQ